MFEIRVKPTFSRWYQSVNLHLDVFALGLVFGLTGATLIDLSDVYGTSPKIVSYTITTRGIGSIISCLLAGPVFRYANIQHVTIASMLVAGVCSVLTPLSGSLALCHVAMLLLGACIGLLEVGTNGWIIARWREKSGTVFQLINLSFGLGGVLAPFMAEPFLSKINTDNFGNATVESAARGANVDMEYVGSDAMNIEALPQPGADTLVYIPYVLQGGLFFAIGVSMIVSYVLDSSNYSPSEGDASDSTCSRGRSLLMVAAFCLYILTVVSLEQTYVSMLAVYVVRSDQLAFSKSDSAFVSAVFWICFTLSRVVSTFVSLRARPSHMLAVCHSVCVGAAMWLVAAGQWSTVAVWVCTGLMGLGVSPMFATALSHVLEYVELSHSHMSFIMLCTCAGGMMPPLLVGPYIEQSPVALLYVTMALSTLALVIMLALILLACGKQVRPSMVKK